MMMVETYNTLPQLRYLGKYPPSMVSPPDHQNGEQVNINNGTDRDKSPPPPPPHPTSPNQPRQSASPPKQPHQSVSESRRSVSPPKQPRRSVSPSRGRSPRAPRRGDSYRPSSPNRRSRGSRSRSRGRPRVDRYASPADVRRRNSYIPQKRSFEEESSSQGREKRRRSVESDEVSEGEIR
jgi:hypothetical protein